jgi:uncharacterized membrane-anchored protein YitT (DUF2179 family)
MIRKAGKLLPNRDYLGILAGAVLFGIAYSWFLLPFRVSPGGVAGLAQILYHFTGIRESLWMFGFNIPLFVLGYFQVGRQFGVRSFAGMMLSNGACWLFAPERLSFVPGFSSFVHNVAAPGELPRLAVLFSGAGGMDILLASVAGSSLLGISLGLIFRFRGSTGGTDIPVAMLKKYAGVTISTGYWMVESVIILMVGVVFGDARLVIWAYLNLFLTTKMTDFSAEGMPFVKAVFIISDRSEEIREAIFRHLDRGVTFLKGQGGYDRRERDVIYVCVHRRQVMVLQKLVKDIDPDAFMVLHDAYDVMGYGFRKRTIDYSDVD